VVAFDELLEHLKQFPETGVQVHPIGVRRLVMKKFPYKIFYIADPDAIFVVAVAHERRHPEYWLHRLDEPGQK
jgi:toxin ParE1/3/4